MSPKPKSAPLLPPPSETVVMEQEVQELRKKLHEEQARQPKAPSPAARGSGPGRAAVDDTNETRVLKEEIERLRNQVVPEPEVEGTRVLEEEVRSSRRRTFSQNSRSLACGVRRSNSSEKRRRSRR